MYIPLDRPKKIRPSLKKRKERGAVAIQQSIGQQYEENENSTEETDSRFHLSGHLQRLFRMRLGVGKVRQSAIETTAAGHIFALFGGDIFQIAPA